MGDRLTGPLSHIRVLDMSRVMAGPWAGQVLADLGADVIKVERPGAGDDTRAWGPPFLKDRAGNETGESAYFLSVNRGKRSIALDLTTPQGQGIVRALAGRSDILLENFKAGALARFGLSYDDLAKVNPRLIYCSITGFGQDGPRRDEAAYDFAIQAMGGLMSVTGEPDGAPGGGPQKVGVPIVDIMTGMYAAVAVLAALAARETTGLGDYIDLAMLDVQASFLANQAMNFLVSGKTPVRTGNAHPNIQPQNVFACADGQIVVAVGNDAQFRQFAAVLGHAEWGADARFAANRQRVINRSILEPMICEILARDRAATWAAKLIEAGVPCGRINSVPEVFAEAQLQHRRMLRTIPHAESDALRQVVSPMNFRNSPLAFDRPPPRLGEHTELILDELGWPRRAGEGGAA